MNETASGKLKSRWPSFSRRWLPFLSAAAAKHYETVVSSRDNRSTDPAGRIDAIVSGLAGTWEAGKDLQDLKGILQIVTPLRVDAGLVEKLQLVATTLNSTNGYSQGDADTLWWVVNKLVGLKKASLERNAAIRIESSLTSLLHLKKTLLEALIDHGAGANVQNNWMQLIALHLNLGEAGAYIRRSAQFVELMQEKARQLGVADLGIEIVDLDALNNSIGILGFVDYLIKGKKLGLLPDRRTVVLCSGEPANRYLLEMYRDHVDLITDPAIAGGLRSLCPYLGSSFSLGYHIDGRFMFSNEAMAHVYKAWDKSGRSALLEMPAEDIARGRTILGEMGLAVSDWFVCLHVRESGFKKDLSIDSPHNCDVTTYLKAAKVIVERGGHVIRIGDASMKPLPEMPGVVDYAHGPWKSDFMDIFLISQCRFFVGTSSGPTIIAHLFGRHCLITNRQPVYERPPRATDMFLIKLYRKRTSGRLMSFPEMFGSPLGYSYNHGQYYVESNLDVVDNHETEIVDAVVEMMDACEGEATGFPPKSELQKRFDRLSTGPISHGNDSRISQSFIEKYRELL